MKRAQAEAYTQPVPLLVERTEWVEQLCEKGWQHINVLLESSKELENVTIH